MVPKRDCEKQTKKELLDFCVKHNIQHSPKSTKPQLCKTIALHFENATVSSFSKRGCSPNKRGDGKTEWRVSELRDIMLEHGWRIPVGASKGELCKVIAAKFVTLAAVEEIAAANDYEKLSIDKLRKICVERGLKGCLQTRKRETFIKKLTESKPPTNRISHHAPNGMSPANAKAKAKAKALAKAPAKAPAKAQEVSIGEKPHFDGKLMANINTTAANLAAMLFLFKKYRKLVCVPLKPSYLKDSGFGENQYCDFEICWTHIITAEGKIEHYMEWSYVTTEELFWEDIEKYCKKRFAIIPMYITGIVNTKQIAHHNYVIFDRELKTVERFEPNGTINVGTIISKIYGEDMLNDILRASARKHGYTYISPLDFCPINGPQHLEELQLPERKDGDPLGFCTFWSLWYADRRLKYPDMPIKILMEKLIDGLKEKSELRTFIRNYAEHIDAERRAVLKLAHKSGENEEQTIIQAFLNNLIGEK